MEQVLEYLEGQNYDRIENLGKIRHILSIPYSWEKDRKREREISSNTSVNKTL